MIDLLVEKTVVCEEDDPIVGRSKVLANRSG
jgi:hypothetical protein